jgi:hypothetical protein
MRRALDLTYAAAMVASAAALVTIAVLVFVQIAGRILDRVLVAAGREAIGLQVPSLAEIGGFLFVAPPSSRCPRRSGPRAMSASRSCRRRCPAGCRVS